MVIIAMVIITTGQEARGNDDARLGKGAEAMDGRGGREWVGGEVRRSSPPSPPARSTTNTARHSTAKRIGDDLADHANRGGERKSEQQAA